MLPNPTKPRFRVGNLSGGGVVTPQNFLSPDMLLLEADRLWNSLSQSEYQRHYMFGDHRTVDFASIRESDIAFHQLWKQKLMNGGGGRMDPAETLR